MPLQFNQIIHRTCRWQLAMIVLWTITTLKDCDEMELGRKIDHPEDKENGY